MKKKRNLTNGILIVIFIVGLSLLLYPSFSDYWNSFHQSRAIASYSEHVSSLSKEEYTEVWEAARAYNGALNERTNSYYMGEESLKDYNELLNLGGNGIMGYIEISKIDCYLPIYHGTDEAVLQVGIGHLDWSSLPVGGEGTHCVLSGHRGLPSAKLFTNLDQIMEGDIFTLHILNEILTYQVDQIRIVLPDELDELNIKQGDDLCTLVTCTPYGINSHRLLIRGYRIDNLPDVKPVTADAVVIEPIIVAPLIAIPILLVLLISLLIPKQSKKKRRGDVVAKK